MKKNIWLAFFALSLAACGQGFNSDSGVDNTRVEIEKVNKEVKLLGQTGTPDVQSTLSKFTHLVNIKSFVSPSIGSGTQGRVVSLIKEGNLIYMISLIEGNQTYGSLDILNIADLQNPTLVYNHTTLNFKYTDLKIKGRALYVVGSKKNGGAVIRMFDLGASGPTSPVHVSDIDLEGHIATSLDIKGDTLYVSTAENGGIYHFYVAHDSPFDLVPKYAGYYPFPNAQYVKAMAMPYYEAGDSYDKDMQPLVLGGSSNSHLYLLDKELELSSSKMQTLSKFAQQGSFIYSSLGDEGLRITEISNFYDGNGFSGFLRQLPVAGSGGGIAHLDQKLYMARGTAGLRIIDVDEPGAPVEVGYLDIDDGGNANNVWVEKYAWNFNVIFVSDGLAGLQILVEDTSAWVNSGDWIRVYAKGTPFAGQNPLMVVEVDGVAIGQPVEVASNTWATYHFNLPVETPVLDGQEVKIRFINDAASSTDDRNLFVGYVRIGGNYYYPWWNNIFNDDGSLFSGPEGNPFGMFTQGYIKLIR